MTNGNNTNESAADNAAADSPAKFYMLDLLHHYGVKARIMNAGPRVRAKACCPFHNEQTPSFEVDLINGKYHCFGCGVSGNAIDLVMAKEGLSRGAAIDWLVKRYGTGVASYISGLQKWMIELHAPYAFIQAKIFDGDEVPSQSDLERMEDFTDDDVTGFGYDISSGYLKVMTSDGDVVENVSISPTGNSRANVKFVNLGSVNDLDVHDDEGNPVEGRNVLFRVTETDGNGGGAELFLEKPFDSSLLTVQYYTVPGRFGETLPIMNTAFIEYDGRAIGFEDPGEDRIDRCWGWIRKSKVGDAK